MTPSSPTEGNADVVSSTYRVEGMTCGHCVSAVTEELSAVDGVNSVSVDLAPGGLSLVTVTGPKTLTDSQIAAALDEAGDYRLVEHPA
jgi:copper chaperone